VPHSSQGELGSKHFVDIVGGEDRQGFHLRYLRDDTIGRSGRGLARGTAEGEIVVVNGNLNHPLCAVSAHPMLALIYDEYIVGRHLGHAYRAVEMGPIKPPSHLQIDLFLFKLFLELLLKAPRDLRVVVFGRRWWVEVIGHQFGHRCNHRIQRIGRAAASPSICPSTTPSASPTATSPSTISSPFSLFCLLFLLLFLLMMMFVVVSIGCGGSSFRLRVLRSDALVG